MIFGIALIIMNMQKPMEGCAIGFWHHRKERVVLKYITEEMNNDFIYILRRIQNHEII